MDAPSLELPPAIVEQLIDISFKTQLGQTVLSTLMNLNPQLKEAVEAVSGNIKVTCQGATLTPGEPPKPPG